MRIALDYDKTFTLDPRMWGKFVAMATRSGHDVVCITMRHPHEPISGPFTKIYYTGRRAKMPWATENGVHIDVWIDDSPAWILTDSV